MAMVQVLGEVADNVHLGPESPKISRFSAFASPQGQLSKNYLEYLRHLTSQKYQSP